MSKIINFLKRHPVCRRSTISLVLVVIVFAIIMINIKQSNTSSATASDTDNNSKVIISDTDTVTDTQSGIDTTTNTTTDSADENTNSETASVVNEYIEVESDTYDDSIYGYSEETIYYDNKNDTVTIKSTNPNGEFLFEIDQPDPNYTGSIVTLSDYDRQALSYLVMGEAGGEGFEGCCLLAQCVRDAMVYRGYDSIDAVISGMGYYAYANTWNDDVEAAISYIFDQGNSAVQHRMLYMYATNMVYSSWHETQNFIIQYRAVRFFDGWD